MPDKFSKKTRSRIMSRIRSANTKPELALKNLLKGNYLRHQPKGIIGKPDFQPATAYIVGYCKREELERRPVPEAGIEEEKYCRISGQLMNSDEHWRSFVNFI